MRKLLILVCLLFAVSLFSVEVNAQTKRRIGLEEGANSVQVKGKISGKRYAVFEIYVGKGDTWDVRLISSNKYIGFTVKAPNGNKYDFLEAAPVEGYYLIRVDLNSTGARSKTPAEFMLEIKFEMEKSRPISE